MAGHGWKALEIAGMDEMSENVWKWMEKARNGWYG